MILRAIRTAIDRALAPGRLAPSETDLLAVAWLLSGLVAFAGPIPWAVVTVVAVVALALTAVRQRRRLRDGERR